MVQQRVIQKRLRWDTADVQTGTAESTALLDTCGVEAELGCSDGGDVSCGATTDDDQVVGFLGGGGGVGTEGVLGDEWSQHFIKLYYNYNYTLVFELSGGEELGLFWEDTICSESSLPVVSLFLCLFLSFIRWVSQG